jgi:Ni/Co efflux regulator RcnB
VSIKKVLLAASAIGTFAFPALSEAQDRDSRREDRQEQRQERREQRQEERQERPAAQVQQQQQPPQQGGRPDRGPQDRPDRGPQGGRPDRDSQVGRPDRGPQVDRPDRGPQGGRPDRGPQDNPQGRPDRGPQTGPGPQQSSRPPSTVFNDRARRDWERQNGVTRPQRPSGGWDRNRDPNRNEWRRDRQQWRNNNRNWHNNGVWNRDRNWWRQNRWFRNYHGPRAYFFFAPSYGYYSVPRQYWGREWRTGDYLPSYFRRYEVRDFWEYGLQDPPYGCAWVWVDNNIVLMDLYDGYIIDVVYNVW